VTVCHGASQPLYRWLEADVEARTVGFSGTWCCQLDESKVVSGDGCAVRLWAHESGRRIATLRGHSGRVTSVTFDDEVILSGCSQGVVKLWSMDELKLSKTLRHHTGVLTQLICLLKLQRELSRSLEVGCMCAWWRCVILLLSQYWGAAHVLENTTY
jgi:WD40 repeat protein